MKDLRKLDDRQLVGVIKNPESGEMDIEEAKEIIYERYEYMPKYMLRYLRLKYPQHDEEDLIHHGYLLISTGINSYNHIDGCAFKSFLFHVIRKGLLNQYFQKDKFRKGERNLTTVCEDYDTSTIDGLMSESIHLEAIDTLMLDEEVQGLKSRLTDAEYKCIMARYLGASYKETAKAFDYTVKQVDNKIQSVRKDKANFLKHNNS